VMLAMLVVVVGTCAIIVNAVRSGPPKPAI
jgi:hypothetical protein